jgi:hypothetical protein
MLHCGAYRQPRRSILMQPHSIDVKLRDQPIDALDL